MSRPDPGTYPSPRRLVALCLVVGVAGTAHAQATDDDPIGRYLHERGLVGSTVRPLPPAPTWRDRIAEMLLGAMALIDSPYRRGGTSAQDGFDCSGFTRHLFHTSLGLVLPRRVDDQAHAPGLVQVQRDQIEPGDLVFFNTLRRTFSHVGIYLGEGKFIHAPRTGAAVRVEDMRVAYWNKRFTGARRSQAVLENPAGTVAAGASPLPALNSETAAQTFPVLPTAPAAPTAPADIPDASLR